MASSLSTHSDRFNSQDVTFDVLAALPAPPALGPHHKPVPHHVLISGFRNEAAARGLTVVRERFAMGAKTAALFGIMDLEPATTTTALAVQDWAKPDQMGLSLGFRSANDLSMAIKAVAGANVFVCDNMVLSGEMFAISRKHTNGLDLAAAIRLGFDKFTAQAQVLLGQIDNLNTLTLTDDTAKVAIFDLFHQAILPVRLLPDVTQFYFDQTDDRPDCLPRTAWGLHNAITRAIKDMKPVPAFKATLAVGRFFGLTGESLEIIGQTKVLAETN